MVPRWAGDANFLPIVGRTKALPILLADTRRLYAEAWPGGGGAWSLQPTLPDGHLMRTWK